MRKTLTYSFIGVLFIATVFVVSLLLAKIEPVEGSVIQGNEYIATSTAANNVYGAFTAATSRLLKTGGGSLAQITVLGAATGALNFYNATTSNVNARTGQLSTSTILIASVPASLAAGTYTFDASFSHGLIVDLVSGTMPTTTITYR